MATLRYLPVEITALIAGYLDDVDLCSFAASCRAIHNAVHCESSSLWRVLFARYFDVGVQRPNNDLKKIYTKRKKMLRRGSVFTDGKSKDEQNSIILLTYLINESYMNVDKHGTPREPEEHSKNLDILQQYTRSHNILDNVLAPRIGKFHPRLLAIQVSLAHFQFDLSYVSPTLGFLRSKVAVYATPQARPIFVGSDMDIVDMGLVSHMVNFFKFHFTRREEYTFFEAYSKLTLSQRPKAWCKPVGDLQLGTRWRGTYSSISTPSLPAFRRLCMRNTLEELMESLQGLPIDDFNTLFYSSHFQKLTMQFSTPVSAKNWPDRWERELRSLSHPFTRQRDSQCQAAHPGSSSSSSASDPGEEMQSYAVTEGSESPRPTNFGFHARGNDGLEFYAFGWLNPLPAQFGIEGWMRFTMIKYFWADDDDESDYDASEDFGDLDDEETRDEKDVNDLIRILENCPNAWCYEGVVIPGGQMIFGRWWKPHVVGAPPNAEIPQEDLLSGPFVFWRDDEV